MEVSDYLAAVRRRWRVVVASVLLGVVAAVLVSWQTTPQYTATSQSFVTLGGDDADTSGLYQESQFTVQRVKSYTQLVSSPLVLQPVVDRLDLTESTSSLARRVSAKSPLNTVLIEVTATDADAATSARIADAVSLELARTIEELEAQRGGTSAVRVSQTRPAVEPDAPTSPRPALNLALGLALGLAGGLALAVLRDRLDTTVRTRRDLDDLLHAPYLGGVGDDRALERGPLAGDHLLSTTGEQFRTLRTNLQFVDIDEPVTSLVLTSAGPGEGKTTTACNLAVTLARSGALVCLVDADLRRPSVARYLGLEGEVGLTDVVVGQVPLDDALIGWGGLTTLSVLPSGMRLPDPNSLLASERLGRTMAALVERFDVVVVDAPPLGPVTDAAILAQRTDGLVLVARHGRTRRAALTDVRRQLDHARARVLGSVLTFAPRRGAEAYGYTPVEDAADAGGGRLGAFARRRPAGQDDAAGEGADTAPGTPRTSPGTVPPARVGSGR